MNHLSEVDCNYVTKSDKTFHLHNQLIIMVRLREFK